MATIPTQNTPLVFGVPIEEQWPAMYGEPESCPQCHGEGFIVDCCDDLCVGAGRCMHGDGNRLCPTCKGNGEI